MLVSGSGVASGSGVVCTNWARYNFAAKGLNSLWQRWQIKPIAFDSSSTPSEPLEFEINNNPYEIISQKDDGFFASQKLVNKTYFQN